MLSHGGEKKNDFNHTGSPRDMEGFDDSKHLLHSLPYTKSVLGQHATYMTHLCSNKVLVYKQIQSSV